MKFYHFCIVFLLFFVACKQKNAETLIVQDTIEENTKTIALDTIIEDDSLYDYLLEIAENDATIFPLDIIIGYEELVNKGEEFQYKWNFYNSHLYTINDKSIVAITHKEEPNILSDFPCDKYQSYLMKKDSDGQWKDVFSEIFPSINLYSFYTLDDYACQRLEGDEQTSFAGYKFEFEDDNTLAVQFMFCCENDTAMTTKLNLDGEQIFYHLED